LIPLSYNARSLVVRWSSSMMAGLGIALVVMILFILFGFVDGMRRTVQSEAESGNYVLLSNGAEAEPNSVIMQPMLELLHAMPQFASEPNGAPLISPEVVAALNVNPGHAKTMFVYLRGVKPIAYGVHRNMKLESGHWPVSGASEWVVGRKLVAKFPALAPPTKFHFGRRNWTIVGVFSDDDSARESEIWCDSDDLFNDFHNKNRGIANVLHVVVKPGELPSLSDTLKKDSRIPLHAESEKQFYAEQNRMADQFQAYGMILAAILGIGAVFGGMNTMYAAVARRSREIGVLRSLGFGPGNVLASFVAESAMLGLAGAIIGEVIGVLVADLTGLNSRLMNVGLLIFSFHLGIRAVAAGLIAGVLIGVIGGFLPAWRASAISINAALREA
jgi:ABC-type lipoprotein release transport system permease subunit